VFYPISSGPPEHLPPYDPAPFITGQLRHSPLRPAAESSRNFIALDLYVTPSLRGSAQATREWFRAFAPRSFSACRPLCPRGAGHPVRSRHAHAFAQSSQRLGTPNVTRFRGFLVHLCYDLLSCLPPLQETFTPGLSTVGHLPVAGYDYGGNWTMSTGGTLTRWNDSFAARALRVHMVRYSRAVAVAGGIASRKSSFFATSSIFYAVDRRSGWFLAKLIAWVLGKVDRLVCRGRG
jgi:hypothetical protein